MRFQQNRVSKRGSDQRGAIRHSLQPLSGGNARLTRPTHNQANTC